LKNSFYQDRLAAMNAPIFVHRRRHRPPVETRQTPGSRDGGSGRDAIENAAEVRRAGRKNLEAEPFGFLPL
jgi:hypothetical protein